MTSPFFNLSEENRELLLKYQTECPKCQRSYKKLEKELYENWWVGKEMIESCDVCAIKFQKEIGG